MIRVGVLRGGTSNQYDQSLATGAYVLKHLPRDRYEPVDIFLDREGIWHFNGTPLGHDKLKMRVDVIWNALHGFYGEDGKVQQLLESLSIPYIGSGPLLSAISMNKKLLKDQVAKLGIKTPRGIYIEKWGNENREETVSGVVRTISTKFSPPWIVEPISRGLANGSMRAKTRDELTAVLLQMFDLDIPVLIEEEVLGKEVSVISSGGFRKQPVYTFLPQENKNPKGRMQKKESEEVQKVAKALHHGLGLGPYSHMRAIIHQSGVYVVGVETLPSLHEGGELHHSLDAVGSSFSEFAEHLIGQAMKGKK